MAFPSRQVAVARAIAFAAVVAAALAAAATAAVGAASPSAAGAAVAAGAPPAHFTFLGLDSCFGVVGLGFLVLDVWFWIPCF